MKKVFLLLLLAVGTTSMAQDMNMDMDSDMGETKILVGASYAGSQVTGDIAGYQFRTLGDIGVINVSVGALTTLDETLKVDYGVRVSTSTDNIGDSFAVGAGAGLRYYPINGFFIRGGAGVGISLDEIPSDLRRAAISAGPGIGFDLGDSVTLLAGYNWQLSNSLKYSDASLKARAWNVGLQVKL